MTTWILVCDAGQARVYAATRASEPWRLVNELDHPAGRARVGALVSDHAGRVRQSGTGAQAPMTAPTDVRAREERRFAGHLAELLAKAYMEQIFDRLMLVAPPRFQHLVLEKLPKSVRGAGIARIHHDYVHLDKRDLEKRLRPLLLDSSHWADAND